MFFQCWQKKSKKEIKHLIECRINGIIEGMITTKKFTQYLIAVGIAFLIFSGTLVSEHTKLFLFSSTVDPFEHSKALQDEIRVSAGEKGQEILSPQGELFIVFPETILNFFKDSRELTQGRVFYSSLFLHPDVRKNILSPDFKKPLTEGQLKIGKLIVQAPQSSILIYRDVNFKVTHVYVWGHQAVLFWEGQMQPLLVSANTKLSIPDGFFAHPERSYQDIQEAFAWENLNPSEEEEMLAVALKRLDIYLKKMSDYTLFLPEIWEHESSNTGISGKVSQIIETLQDNFAIGLSKKGREQKQFLEFLTPFIKANQLIREGKTALGTRKLSEFNATAQSASWKVLLDKNTKLASEWNHFLMAHKAWVNNSFDQPAEDFFSAWNSLENTGPMQLINQHLFLFEKNITRGLIRNTKKEVAEMQKILTKSEFLEEDAGTLTQIRRLLSEAIGREVLLQNEESFSLITNLTRKELALHQDVTQTNEIKIEGIRFTLSFLKTFLEDRTRIESSRILIQLYAELSAGNFLENQTVDVLTTEEKELASFLVLLGNTGLTPEEIEMIKAEHELQKSLADRIVEIQEKQDAGGNDQNLGSGQLKNAKYLNDLFESIGVPTDTMYFSTNRSEGVTAFRDGQWKGMELSGTFHYPTQFFKILTIGEKTKENFHARFLSGFLLQIEEEGLVDPNAKGSGESLFVSQNTPQAILERKLAQELLALHSFNVSRENILILDKEMSAFKVSNAQFNDGYFLDFFFNKADQTIESVSFLATKKKVSLEGKVFLLQTVEQTLSEEIKKATTKSPRM